jgi:hypothetical protein
MQLTDCKTLEVANWFVLRLLLLLVLTHNSNDLPVSASQLSSCLEKLEHLVYVDVELLYEFHGVIDTCIGNQN